MAVQNVISATGSTTGLLGGITRFACSLSRTVTPVYHEDEDWPQCAAVGGWQCSGSLEGVDPDQLLQLENIAVEDLTVVLAASDGGGTARTFTVENCSFHGFSMGSGSPGDPATSSISFEAISDNGTETMLTVA